MRPIVAPGRVVGLDMARCLALIGMMATHVLAGNDENGVTFVQQLAGGRASALFAVLAGVSLALMSGRSTPLRGRELAAASAGLAVRAVLIATIGFALGDLQTGIAIILTYYGVLFLLGLPFLGLRAPALFALSGAWLLVVPVLSHLLRPHLPDRGYDSPHFGMLADPGRLLSELTFTGYYPVVPWLAYLLVGMAIGRLDLSRRRTPWVLTAAGAVIALVSWFGSRLLLDRPGVMATLSGTYVGPRPPGDMADVLTHGLYGNTPTGSWWWLAVRAPHTATPFDLASTIGSALVVIALCVVIGSLLPRTTAVAFGAGAMTLTLYSAHVWLRTPDLWPEDGMQTFVQHVVFAVAVGAVYRLARLRGPLETMVSTIADGTRLLVRRPSVTSARR